MNMAAVVVKMKRKTLVIFMKMVVMMVNCFLLYLRTLSLLLGLYGVERENNFEL
jgi:hypothetical protein